MSKTLLAFDIGDSYIKIAKQERDRIQVFTKQLPENMVKDGIIQLPHMMVEFLKEVRKEFSLPKCDCALIVPDELVVCRKLTLPAMTEKQLEVNLPFEFSDFITGKPTRYTYDYAVEELISDEEGNPTEMHLTAAVMSKESVADYIDMFRGAGFRLVTLIPQEVAFTNIMKLALKEQRISGRKEYCLVNVGHRSTQVYIFKADKLNVLRKVYVGGLNLDKAIAENEIIDEFLARTHKTTNYNNVLDTDYAQEVYTQIALEVRKVINFYRYNNRESGLSNIYILGGGSNIQQLCDQIAKVTELENQQLTMLLPKIADKTMDLSGVCATGALLQ